MNVLELFTKDVRYEEKEVMVTKEIRDSGGKNNLESRNIAHCIRPINFWQRASKKDRDGLVRDRPSGTQKP